MAIRYIAYTAEGEKVTGTLPVETPGEAERLLEQSDLIVASLKSDLPLTSGFRSSIYRQLPTLFRPKPRELAGFTRELATLLQAGIALHTSLTILQGRIANPLLRDAVVRIAHEIAEGTSLSGAIAKYPSLFPNLYSRLVAVAEETGDLARSLEQIATYLEKQAALGRKVAGALRYPAFVAAAGIVAGYFLVSFSLPALAGLFKEFGGELPLTARILIGVTAVAQVAGKWVILVGGATAAVAWLYSRTAQGARRRDAVLLRVPLVGKLVHLSGMFRITSNLNTMLTAGLPLVEALDLTVSVVGNSVLRDAVVKARDELLEGRSFSQALTHQLVFPPVVSQMVEVGEQSGTLSQNLGSLANFFDQETDRIASNLTGTIEPLMILLVGGGVGFIAIATVSALYGVMGQIK